MYELFEKLLQVFANVHKSWYFHADYKTVFQTDITEHLYINAAKP